MKLNANSKRLFIRERQSKKQNKTKLTTNTFIISPINRNPRDEWIPRKLYCLCYHDTISNTLKYECLAKFIGCFKVSLITIIWIALCQDIQHVAIFSRQGTKTLTHKQHEYACIMGLTALNCFGEISEIFPHLIAQKYFKITHIDNSY